jgi:pimeloyl-ACP methyl ester carboxylesterase
MTATRHLASTFGVELAVHDLGGLGRPALLAHATGFHGRVWEPLAAKLSGVHAWAPDLRGHGDSPVPPDHDFAWSRFADDVLATLDGLGLTSADPTAKPIGVGHSKGGAALLLAEERRPGTFAALWCYEPVVFPHDLVSSGAENPLAAGARRRRATFDSFDAAYDNYAAKPPLDELDPTALRAYVEHGFIQQDDGTVTLKCRPENEARVFEMAMASYAFEHLPEVACPVTVVRGRAEVAGPASFADRVAGALPQGRLEVHEDLGHFGPLESPGRMAASVQAVIDAA